MGSPDVAAYLSTINHRLPGLHAPYPASDSPASDANVHRQRGRRYALEHPWQTGLLPAARESGKIVVTEISIAS
jgi:hypothetical protein